MAMDSKLLQHMVAVFCAHGERKQRALMRRLAREPRRAWPLLRAICTGPYPPAVRRWAVEAVGWFPERQALPLVRRGLRDPHMSVRLHAVTALCRLGNPKLARELRPLLDDASGGVRVNVLAALGKMKPRWLPDVLRRALDDPKVYVRRCAEKLLADE